MVTIELAIPKTRTGRYFPSLLEPRRRAERALRAVAQEAYVHGVSTRKVDDLLKALGPDGMSDTTALVGARTHEGLWGTPKCYKHIRGTPPLSPPHPQQLVTASAGSAEQ